MLIRQRLRPDRHEAGCRRTTVTWCSPATRTIVNFSEGDVTTTVCETDAEFVAQNCGKSARWNDEAGYGPMKIDPGHDDGLRQAFERLGVADLLH